MPDLLTQPASVPNPQPSLGMAKTAPIPVVAPPVAVETDIQPAPVPSETLSAPSWENIPIDMIRYFGKDIGSMTTRDIEQLKDIDKWSREGLLEDSIGGRLQKIRSLESRLGAPGLHESKVDKLWAWVKMQFSISELQKRQSAFER
jgi:hypothetical protein